jgi:ankyrin repeat protein
MAGVNFFATLPHEVAAHVLVVGLRAEVLRARSLVILAGCSRAAKEVALAAANSYCAAALCTCCVEHLPAEVFARARTREVAREHQTTLVSALNAFSRDERSFQRVPRAMQRVVGVEGRRSAALLFAVVHKTRPGLVCGSFIRAVRLGAEACVRMWLEAGVDVNLTAMRARRGRPPYAMDGDEESDHLSSGPDGDEQLDSGNESESNSDVWGFYPWKSDVVGWTPLALAAYFGHEDVVRLLLEAGAKPDTRVLIRGAEHETPLMLAVRHREMGVVRALLEAGADVNAEDEDGRTPFSILHNHEALARLLLSYGANPRASGSRPLFMALSSGHNVYARFLIDEAGVDVNATDESGETALERAMSRGDLVMLRALVRRGADASAALQALESGGFSDEERREYGEVLEGGHGA